jgi:murein L,D-transpeptidase YafK
MRFVRPVFGRPAVRRVAFATLIAGAALGLAACDEGSPVDDLGGMAGSARASHPLSPRLVALMQEKGVSPSSAVLIRTYKKEAEFEIWKMKPDGRYVLFKTYPMCRWSGQLGPKMAEGDRQVPEGFYRITPSQMNPVSQYYLSFNVGYPNAYDRAHGASGSSIFVHGACSSAGCFSMTDEQIDQIYAIAREAFTGGQQAIQMQSYPFRMTAENMAKYRNDPNIEFWKQLKEGADNFEVAKQDVTVGVCNRHYVFNTTTPASHMDPAGPCPALQHDGIQNEVAAREADDDAKVAKLVASGTPAMRTIYADGGQNAVFKGTHADDVSRPEALTAGATDWLVEPAGGKATSPLVKVAAARRAAKVAKAAKAKPVDAAAADRADRTSSIKKPEAKSQAAL